MSEENPTLTHVIMVCFSSCLADMNVGPVSKQSGVDLSNVIAGRVIVSRLAQPQP